MYGRLTSRQVHDAIKFMEEHRNDDEVCNVAYDKVTRSWNAWYTGDCSCCAIVGQGLTAVDAAHHLIQLTRSNQ